MGNKPLISVIMNGHNGEEFLTEAIDSVLAQTYENWEILFWDNLSTDSTKSIVQSYSDKRIRYFYGNEFLSLGKARNEVIKQAKGDMLGFLDCDDLRLPEKLERQVPLFLDAEVGIVYSDTYFFNSEGRENRMHSRVKPYRGWCFKELLIHYGLSLETVMIRRSALDKLDHWFDDRFSAIEEVDLFVRIGQSWKVDYVPEPLAKWRVHSSSWTWSKPQSFIEEKELMLQKLEKTGIKNTYARALNEARAGLAFAKAKFFWSNGEGGEARREIKGKKKSLKMLLLWGASFFPYKFIMRIRSKLNGTVEPA